MKHTHIHVHGDIADAFETQDNWDDWNAKHAHHTERAKHHQEQMTKKGKDHEDWSAHSSAKFNHTQAASTLATAVERAKQGKPGGGDDYHEKAQKLASRASAEEAKIKHKPTQDLDSYRRDQMGKFATSSGTGEQHAATAELHTSLATRKGTDHPHHALHMAAAEAHTEASKFLQQANKAQHPGAAIAAEAAAKKARTHENLINKGRGSKPDSEVQRQNKAMSDPRVMAENKARKAEFDEKNKGKPKGAKAKDAADCGCGGNDDPIDADTNLFDYGTNDLLFMDASGELPEPELPPHTAYAHARAHADTLSDGAFNLGGRINETSHVSHVDKAVVAHEAAGAAHVRAGECGSKIPYAGANDYVSQHAQRAVTHATHADKFKKLKQAIVG